MSESNEMKEKENPVKEQNSTSFSEGVKGFANQTKKTVAQAKHDSRDIAEPAEGLNIKNKNKSSKEKVIKEEKVSGVEDSKMGETKTQTKELAKEESTPQDENEAINSRSRLESGDVLRSKKKAEKEDESELLDPSNSKEEDGEISGVEPETQKQEQSTAGIGAIGDGEKSKKGAHLKIDHIIGKQQRELMSNGQQVVALIIDKQKWLNTKPDKNGNLKMSLYSPMFKGGTDNFSESIIKVPKSTIAAMPVDESGRIKLLVAENKPGQKSKLEVHIDSGDKRAELIEKNKNILTHETEVMRRNRVLDQPLKNSYGQNLEVKGKDLVKNMNSDQRNIVQKMNSHELEGTFKHPKNVEKYEPLNKDLSEKTLKDVSKEVDLDAFRKDQEKGVNLNIPPIKESVSEKNQKGISGRVVEDAKKEAISTEKALETQVTPEKKYKDFVNKMDVDQQGAIKKQSPDEIQKKAEQQKAELSKNEKQLDKSPQINKILMTNHY
jgi:hypothetical protein